MTRPAPDDRTAAWLDEVAAAAGRGRDGLLARQMPDGHWVGELEGDTILESEFVLLLAFLGRADDPRIRPLASYLLKHQVPDGGWANYPGGPAEVSVSVKACDGTTTRTSSAPCMAVARSVVARRLSGSAMPGR